MLFNPTLGAASDQLHKIKFILMWVERNPMHGETVKFQLNNEIKIGVFIKRAPGSAQNYWVIDIGSRYIYAWDLTTFEVWQNK